MAKMSVDAMLAVLSAAVDIQQDRGAPLLKAWWSEELKSVMIAAEQGGEYMLSVRYSPAEDRWAGRGPVRVGKEGERVPVETAALLFTWTNRVLQAIDGDSFPSAEASLPVLRALMAEYYGFEIA